MGTYLVPEKPRAWLMGARVYATAGLEDKTDWADKW
jgi:hypothetical protein